MIGTPFTGALRVLHRSEPQAIAPADPALLSILQLARKDPLLPKVLVVALSGEHSILAWAVPDNMEDGGIKLLSLA